MRKWHRWISIFFGVFFLWIAGTGLASQLVPLFSGGEEHEHEAGGEAEHAAPMVPAGFVCPETMTCRPRQPEGGGNIVGYLHHLHSGEEFGPVGVAISILSGFALLFFSFSGLWMYFQMWRNRAKRALSPRWFWK